jgi:hypothetical protein
MNKIYSTQNRSYVIPMVAILALSMAIMPTLATSAFAEASIRLDATGAGAPIVIVDNDPEDGNPAVGRILISLGVNGLPDTLGCLTGSVDSSITKPVHGDETMPVMDLLWVAETDAPGICNATIELTETNFFNKQIALSTGVGGTTQGLVDYSVFADSTNTPFGQEFPVFSDSYDPVDPDVNFGSSGGSTVSPDGLYSITLKMDIEHDGAGITSGDSFLTGEPVVAGTIIPIDSSALLIGSLGSVSMWMIPAVAGMASAGIYLVKFRKHN